MNKEQIKKFKKELEKEKSLVESELKKIASKDKNIKGDWDTKYPEFGAGSTGSLQLEEAADEVEEYMTLLPIEHNLELKLQKINSALERIKKGDYGKCRKCSKEIPGERLKVYPEAEFCGDCQK